MALAERGRQHMVEQREGDDEGLPVASIEEDDDPEAYTSDEPPEPDAAWDVVDNNLEWYKSGEEVT
jgi:hypothetical protein